jgi:hypothetical protein
MPLYFFDVRDPERTSIDKGEGLELPDLESATDDARAAIREIVADRSGEGERVDFENSSIDIREGDVVVANVAFAEAFEPRREGLRQS